MLAQRKSNKKVSRGPPPRNQSAMRELISHPPQLNGPQIKHSVTLRFLVNSAVSQSITVGNLLDTMLFAATATQGYQIFQAVKIRRVRIWAAPVTGGATSVSLEYAGLTAGAVGDQMIHTDTSMGVQPAHVSARPSAKSTASTYQVSTAINMFYLTAPVGSVVDVEATFRNSFVSAVAVAQALVGATVGATYLRGLDGLPVASSKFTPEYQATPSI